MSKAIDGRWCGARVPPQGACSYRWEGMSLCGGELLYRRRLETRGGGQHLVSYLVCQFCGSMTEMLDTPLEGLDDA